MKIENGLETIYNISVYRLRINFVLNKVFLVQFTSLFPYSTDFYAPFSVNALFILCRFIKRRKQTLNVVQPTNSYSGLVLESLQAAVFVLCKSLFLIIVNVLNIWIINLHM